jgi:hypothetical protein
MRSQRRGQAPRSGVDQTQHPSQSIALDGHPADRRHDAA